MPAPASTDLEFVTHAEHWSAGRYYTDASGGKHTKSIIARRVGYGAVRLDSLEPLSGHGALAAFWGPLPGLVQTVNRGELLACVRVLERIGQNPCPGDGDTILCTDSSYVWKGFNIRGEKSTVIGSNWDLWERLWRGVDQLGGRVQVTKVAAHQHCSGMVYGISRPIDWVGNAIADALSKHAASEAQVSDDQFEAMQALETRYWQIQHRIVSALVLATALSRPARRRGRTATDELEVPPGFADKPEYEVHCYDVDARLTPPTEALVVNVSARCPAGQR